MSRTQPPSSFRDLSCSHDGMSLLFLIFLSSLMTVYAFFKRPVVVHVVVYAEKKRNKERHRFFEADTLHHQEDDASTSNIVTQGSQQTSRSWKSTVAVSAPSNATKKFCWVFSLALMSSLGRRSRFEDFVVPFNILVSEGRCIFFPFLLWLPSSLYSILDGVVDAGLCLGSCPPSSSILWFILLMLH